ncbi:hypothetical protein HMPREF0765_4045 [Sphingobacterium spiritivorum ATCC 33300]|uniref:Uncharacterized protein n=1 Tax=Sphingobacterium spiritivorum ATCC 33300 TaxID=525372 RepID=C2G389_SPHSI|nr:hypothetical protein HMPREF0765_4045 [Sphingobacterium spiritivorum ATCC 33300]
MGKWGPFSPIGDTIFLLLKYEKAPVSPIEFTELSYFSVFKNHLTNNLFISKKHVKS